MGRALLALLLLLGVAWAQPEVPDGGVFVPATEDEEADAGPPDEAPAEGEAVPEDGEAAPEAGAAPDEGGESGQRRRGRRGGRDRGGEGASRRDPRLEAIVEQFRPLQGRPVLGVSITCDFAECAAPERNTVLRQITRLDRGTPLRPEDVADAWLRLVSTGLFRDLRVDAAPRGAQVEVRFTGVWAVVITDLRIEYDRLQSRLYPQQFRSEIRKRLSFRKGSSFPPLQADGRFSPADQAEIDDQRARIADLYERQGYEGTEVEFLPEYHGENRKFVELVVRVHEGRQPEIGQVLVQGNQAFSYSRILAALSTGERVDFWRDLFGAFGLGRYAQRQFREELKGVEALYRSQGYVAARVRLEGTVQRRDGKVFPLVRVREGPRVTASFEGNESLDDEELAAVLTFEGTGAYDETEIASSIEAIKDLYQEIARYYVEVEASAERTPTDGVHVRFQIDEGPRVYVRAIELVGSKAIPLEELLAAMETKGVAPDGVINTFVASSGVLQDARVINDLLALRNLYYDRGFLGVRFRCADPRLDVATWTARRLQEIRPSDDFGPAMDPSWFAGRFDVWSEDPIRNRCFLVESDADPRLVTLHMELSEGPRTTVDRVAIDALLAGMDAEMRDEAFALLQTLGLVDDVRRPIKGAGLNPKKIQAIRSFVLRYFHREGYLQAEITPLCFSESGSARSHADCTTGRLYGAHIDRLQFDITPGPRSEVDGVLLRGNLLTKPAIIEHELLLSDRGALGTDALFRSQANLRSLGVFDSVSVTPIGRTENSTRYAHANPTTVNVVVEEGRYQIIDTVLGLQIASTPLSADELPVLYTAGISARDRNLLGRAVEGGVGFTHANRIDTPQDVSGDDASWEVGLFFKDRRLFGTRLDLTVEIPFEQGQTAQRDAYQQVFSAKTVVGYDFYNLSYPAEWGRGMRTTWTLEFHRERRRPLTRASERPPYDDFDNFLSLAPALTWERRDNSLHPTRGWFASLATEAVSSDFGIDPDVSFKATLIGQTVHSFFERRLIIAPTLRVGGVITDRREADLPGDFLYKAGGDSVALPVRGYADASIEACRARDIDPFCVDVFDPEDEDRELPFTVGGRAMVSGSLELRWPTFLLDDFWFAAFVDVGAVAIQWDRITDDDIFPSVGGGLRWLVTGQIPLRLDVGVPLRATAFSPQEPRLHLNIFYTL